MLNVELSDRSASIRAKKASASRKTDRIRGVDPTMVDKIYSDAEFEFLRAIQEYKSVSNRPYPTNSELLRIMTEELGYSKGPVSREDEVPVFRTWSSFSFIDQG